MHNTGQTWQKKDGDNEYVRELEQLGKKVEDWWIDIYPVDRLRKEMLGYPTQKPEKLLERIIKASSNEGDVILDAYCGCGTTIIVSEKLKRQWIGIDITYQSIALILKRLEDNFNHDFTKAIIDSDTKAIKQPATLLLNGVPKDFESAVALANKRDDRTRKEFEKWLILTYSRNRAMVNEKKGGDRGIDGIAYISDRNEKGEEIYQKIIFSVKSSKKLIPEMIDALAGAMEKENAVCGIFLSLYSAKNLIKTAKEYGVYHNHLVNRDYAKVQIISVDDMFNGSLIDLPNVSDVLKKAQSHQTQLDIEEMS